MARARKADRSHKSKKEQRRLAKSSTVTISENGFVQRKKKPAVLGVKVKSQLVRIDAGFAAFLRREAKVHGAVTEVTRLLNTKAAVLSAMIEPQGGK